MSIHHVEQANPCVEAACVLCGAWDPDDPANDCPAWAVESDD